MDHVSYEADNPISHDADHRYVCVGSVRGWCGTLHRSGKAAEECCERDSRDCQRAGGYSDRHIRPASDARWSAHRGYYV